MRTVHRASIAAPVDTAFALARDVEAWPRLLSSYRWCRVQERTADRLVFAMGGWVRGWPARWTAVQEARPQEGCIRFVHLRGITRGMRVEWRFTAGSGTTQVVLVHDLVLDWPLIGRLVSDLIVGPVFIDYIARRTLQVVKTHAEAAAAAPAPGGAHG
jgi:ribosome-associated toxin RatA of RatAB toxin-antitoxin module